jgi:ribonuclease T1
MKHFKTIFWLISCLFLFLDCQSKQSGNIDNSHKTENYEPENSGRKHKKRHKNSYNKRNNYQYNRSSSESKTTNIPQKVKAILAYVRSNHRAMEGYVGGRRFKNLENQLEERDASGKKINYQEWDVNPKEQGRNRGTERLVTGSDGRAWFTSDHYRSFVEVKF